MGDGRTSTYGQLVDRAGRVASLLRAHGLRRGDAVALMLRNGPEFFEVAWGCQLSGLYYVPVNTHLTLDEVEYIVDDSESKAIVLDGTMPELAGALAGRCPGAALRIMTGAALAGWDGYEQ